MSKPREFYTAKELMDLIDHARAAGVQQIKVPGFEVIWPLQPVSAPSAAHTPPTVRTRPPQTFNPPAVPRLAVVQQGVQKVPPKVCQGCGGLLKQTAKIGSLCVPCVRAKQARAPQLAQQHEPPICEIHREFLTVGKVSNDWYCHECYVEEKKSQGLWRE